MATIKTEGLQLFSKQFEKLTNEIANINNMALYDAAGAVADELNSALKSLPTREESEWGTANKKLYGATESEKQQLIESLGVASFKKSSNSTDTSIGFTGYINTPSTRFGDMIPAGMLMQCIEYGTSFRQGTHTLTAATKRCKSKAEKAIEDRIDKEVNKIMK